MKANFITFVRGLKNGTPPRFQSSLKSLILLVAVVMSVNVWGASYSLSGSEFGTSAVSSYADGPATLTGADGGEWKVAGYGVTANTSVIIGKSGANYLETPLCGGNITSVVVSWSGNTSYYLALQTTSGLELEAKQNTSGQTYTFNVTGNYTQLRLVGRRSGTGNAAATITAVTVNYSSAPIQKYNLTYHVGSASTTIQVNSGTKLSTALKDVATTSCDNYSTTFMGWSTAPITGKIQSAPEELLDEDATVTEDMEVWAVWAKKTDKGTKTTTLTLNAGTKTSPFTNNGAVWTFSNLTFVSSGNNSKFNNNASVSCKLPIGATANTFTITRSQSWSGSGISITLKGEGFSSTLKTFSSDGSYTFTNADNAAGKYTLSASIGSNKNAWTKSISINYNDVSYSDYLTTCAPTFAITPSVMGNGTIQFSTNGTNWSNSITDQEAGAEVYFKLVPNAGYEVQDGSVGITSEEEVLWEPIAGEINTYYMIMPAAPVTVSAAFVQPATYIILYDKGNWESAEGDVPDPDEVTPGTNYTINSTDKLSLTGYTFKGWNTDKNATTGLTNITVNDDIILYAIFTINSYNVTFSPSITGGSIKVNGSSISPVSVEYNSDVTITVTPTSKYFKLTTLTYNSTDIKDTKKFTMPAENVEIAYSFTEDPKVTVTFKNNGETLTTDGTREVYVNDPIGTLPTLTSFDAKDARSKTFVGWTTDKLTNWQEQAPTLISASTTVTEALELNAVWAKGGDTFENMAYGTELTTGKYLIEGYYSSLDYALGATFSSGKNTATKITCSGENGEYWTLETDNDKALIWTITVYEDYVTLYNESASKYLSLPSSGTMTTSATLTDDCKFTASGTNEEGKARIWTIKSKTNSTITNNALSCYTNSGTTYFNAFKSQTHNIYLYKQNISDYITHSSSSPLASITLNTDDVKKNYFVGETFTSANLSATAKLEDNIEFPVEHDALTIEGPSDLSTAGEKTVTVKYTFNNQEQSAEYKVNAYSVTINPVYTDRVNDEPVTDNKYSWNPETHALTFSTQAHYQFNGISELSGATQGGTKPNYTLSNPTDNVTLTATWQRLFTLKYDSKGGAAVSFVTDVTKNTIVETMPSPKFTGYNLVGWFDNEGCTGDAVTFPYAITKDETLFAKWEVKTTTITFSQEDATTKGTEQVIATWGQPMPEATMPQREHYQFAGYTHSNVLYYNADGTSAKNWDKEDATATLTAQWNINKHNINLPAVLAGGSLSFSTGTSDVSYNATVTITATPNTHYTLTALTWNGHNILSSKSFQMPDDDVTIEATFTEDPKRTISWSVGGSIAATTNDVYDGTAFATIKAQAPNVGDKAAGDCADKFMGWAIAPINTQGGIDKDAVQWADDATTSETQNTFYAVFASKVGEEPTSVEFTPTSLDVSGTSAVQKTQQLDDITFTFSAVSLYSKKARMAKNSTISQDKEFGGDIISISFDDFAYSATTKGSLTIKGCATANGSYTTIATQGADYAGASVNFTSGYKCFKVEVGSDRTADFSKMVVNYKTTSYGNYITQCCTTPTNPLAITNTNLTVKTNGTLELQTTEGIKNVTKVWASENGAVATVDQNGVVTPVATGKATITVSQTAIDGFCAQYDEVEIEVIAANEFSIAFAAADGGTTVAKVNGTPTNKATTGTTVTITATPVDDYNFTGWTVNAGGVTLADASSATTTFTMDEADVEITPSFALKQFTVTLNAGTGTVETASYTENVHNGVTLPAAAHCQPDIWVFQGWSETNVTEVLPDCPTLVDNNYEITKDVTLYAIYKKADGGEKTIGYKISYQANNTTYYASSGVTDQKMGVSTDADDAVVFGMTTTSGQAKLYRVDENGTLISGSYIYLDSQKKLTEGNDYDNDKHKWTISMTGTHSIVNVGETGRCIAGRSGKEDNKNVVNASVANVDKPEGVDGNYFHHITLVPVVKGAASYCTSPECVSLTWINGMSDADPVITYPSTDGKLVLPTETPTSCAPNLYGFVGWTKTEIPTYKTSQQEIVTAETAAPEHATTYYAEFVNTAGNHYRTTCPETLYAITYNANSGEEEDYIQYSENKTNVTSYDGAAFSKTACSLYQWNTAADGTGMAYKPNATISSLADIVGNGTTGTLYAQWTGDLSVTGNVNLTSGKGITVYTTAAAGNLITISCPAIDMVHHIRYKFLDSENNEVNTLKLCNNGTDNFNQLTNIATDGVVGEYEQTFSICYTPTEHNQKATYTLLLEGVDQGGNTVFNRCSLSVAVRSLPEQFVIAIKKDKQWYAVPNVLGTTSSETVPNALAIEVDDNANPTYVIPDEKKSQILFQAASHPGSITWRRGGIRFQSVETSKFITASYSDVTSFYMPSGNSDAQQFYLTSADCNKYKVTLDPAGYTDNIPDRWMSVYGSKIGWYNTQACDVYFLPINEYVVIRENLPNGKIGSMCQAKSIAAVKGGQLYQPNFVEGNYLEFIEVKYPVEAGMPLIYQADGTNDGNLAVMYGAGVAVEEALTEGTRGMVGYIGEGTMDVPNYSESNKNYVFQNNKLYQANQNYLTNDRAYINLGVVQELGSVKEESTATPRRRLSMGVPHSTATGLNELLEQGTTQCIKFIRDNKLFILREGKLYDATGKKIK